MSLKMFGQIVLLIIILAFVTTAVKCLHKNTCPQCKAMWKACSMKGMK